MNASQATADRNCAFGQRNNDWRSNRSLLERMLWSSPLIPVKFTLPVWTSWRMWTRKWTMVGDTPLKVRRCTWLSPTSSRHASIIQFLLRWTGLSILDTLVDPIVTSMSSIGNGSRRTFVSCTAIPSDHAVSRIRCWAIHPFSPFSSLNAYPRQPSSNLQEDLLQLFNEAEHMHDITLQINNYQTFPAHKYILAMRSPYFRERISSRTIDQLSIENDENQPIDADLFRMILEYIYSDKCPWLNFVQRIQVRDENEYQAHLARMKANEDDDIDDHRYFTRVRQQAAATSEAHRHQQGSKSKKKKKAGRYFFCGCQRCAHLCS